MQKEMMARSSMAVAVNSTACRLFAKECGIDRRSYEVEFVGSSVQINTRKIGKAVQLYQLRGCQIARKLWEWGCKRAEIWNGEIPKPIVIPASQSKNKTLHSNIMANSEPIISVPTLEIGQLTLSKSLISYLDLMLENASDITGIVRIQDELQVAMSASSVALLTTTTVKQAVKRKRPEFWHPADLLNFRMQTGELVRDLRQGIKNSADTDIEVSWRCVSGTGKWRMITHRYQTFIDDRGVAYQFSKNVGSEAIETPKDLVLI